MNDDETNENELMDKFNELCQYAIFRWCVFVAPLFTLGMFWKFGLFCFCENNYRDNPYSINHSEFDEYKFVVWFLIFTLPTVWVWRRPIWKRIKQSAEFFNRSAEGD